MNTVVYKGHSINKLQKWRFYQYLSKLAAFRRGRSLGAKISGGRGRPLGIFFGFYKTRHILLSDSANCTVLRAVILTQYRRVADGQTDRQTDGKAIASTVLAMRALRRAVKTQAWDCNESMRQVLKSLFFWCVVFLVRSACCHLPPHYILPAVRQECIVAVLSYTIQTAII